VFIRRALVLNVGVISAGVAQLFLLGFLSRYSSVETLGHIAMLMVIHGFISLLGDLGLTPYSVYLGAPIKLSRKLKILSFSFVGLFVLAASHLLLAGADHLYFISACLIIGVWGRLATFKYEATTLLLEQFGRLAASDTAAYILGRSSVTLFIGLWLDYAAAFAAGIAAFFWVRYTILTWRLPELEELDINSRPDVSLRNIIRYLKDLQLAAVSNYAFNTAEIIALRYFAGVAFVGSYSRLTHLNSIATNYFSVFAEKFAFRYFTDPDHSRSAINFFMSRILPAILTAGIMFSATIFLFGERIVEVFLGDQWISLVEVYSILAVVVGLRIANKFQDSLIRAKRLFTTTILSHTCLAILWVFSLSSLIDFDFVYVAKIHVAIMIINFFVTHWILMKDVGKADFKSGLLMVAYLIMCFVVIV